MHVPGHAGAVFFDIDGTLVPGTSSSAYLASHLGHSEAAEAAYAAGEIDSHQVCVLGQTPTSLERQETSMGEKPASEQIDDIVGKLDDWRGETLSRLRSLITQADPAIIEEVKWKMPSRPEGLPVWSSDGIVCIAEPFKRAVKLTFFKGAQLKDPKGLFNSRLRSKTDRAIDFHAGDAIDESGLMELVRQAVELNKTAAK
jgi:hypothetical protein